MRSTWTLSSYLPQSCSPASTKVSRFGLPWDQCWGLGLVSNHPSLSGFWTMWEQTWATREESESLIFFIFDWLMIGLRCWFDFCQTSTWATMGMSHMSPPSGIPLPPPTIPTPLGGYRALVWVPRTTQQIPIDYAFTDVSAYAFTLLLIYCFESWVGKYGKASLLLLKSGS